MTPSGHSDLRPVCVLDFLSTFLFFLGFTWGFGCFSHFFPHNTNDIIDVFFEAEWRNRFNTQSSNHLEREVITFSSMARVINVNLCKLCLLKKLAAKKLWSTRCARLVWQGLMLDVCSVFQKMKCFGLLHVIMSTLGGKKPRQPKTQQTPTILPLNHPTSKKNPTTQTIQNQNGAYIKDKKDFNELWFIRRYGISDSSWEQSKSQEQLTDKTGYKTQIWNALSSSNLHTMKPHIYYFWLLRSISHCVISQNKAGI